MGIIRSNTSNSEENTFLNKKKISSISRKNRKFPTKSLTIQRIFLSIYCLCVSITMCNCLTNSGKFQSQLYRQFYDDYQDNNLWTETAIDANRLQTLIIEGLGLTGLPDMNKLNISHSEYIEKYNLYLNRINKRRRNQQNGDDEDQEDATTQHQLYNFYPVDVMNTTKGHRSRRSIDNLTKKRRNKNIITIRFQLPATTPTDATTVDQPVVDDSRLRLMITKKLSKKNRQIDMPTSGTLTFQIYQHLSNKVAVNDTMTKRFRMIVEKSIDLLDLMENVDETSSAFLSKWLEFDVTEAVDVLLQHQRQHKKTINFQIICADCRQYGWQIVHRHQLQDNNPVLHVVGRLSGVYGEQERQTNRHFSHLNDGPPPQKMRQRKTDCMKNNRKCCRHSMKVEFKKIPGFEFIIQPKSFDAGFCRGKCPPRYNPANHHAVLQSLIWQQDKLRAPRPCCAPSKLVELEVLHVDENDPAKLKVSTWQDMKVVECACS